MVKKRVSYFNCLPADFNTTVDLSMGRFQTVTEPEDLPVSQTTFNAFG